MAFNQQPGYNVSVVNQSHAFESATLHSLGRRLGDDNSPQLCYRSKCRQIVDGLVLGCYARQRSLQFIITSDVVESRRG